MPEGDTVWRQARLLNAALQGKELNRSDFRVPGYATTDLTGFRVARVYARGKHLLIECASERLPSAIIHSHLKMEGSWHLYPPGVPWRRPAHTARAVLEVPDAVVVGFSLGILEVLTEAELALDFLGPDLLGPDWDAAEAIRRLAAEPGRAIGLALLDQRNLAGIGNIYRNELCFLVGAHPGSAVRGVDLARVVHLAKRLLEANKSGTGEVPPAGQPEQTPPAGFTAANDGPADAAEQQSAGPRSNSAAFTFAHAANRSRLDRNSNLAIRSRAAAPAPPALRVARAGQRAA